MSDLNEFSIPPLPEKLVSCISYMYKDSFNYDVLSKKITTDAGLTEKILLTANSAYYSQGAPPTTSVKQALTRIGGTNLLKILTDTYYKNTFQKVDIDFFTFTDFTKHSNYVSHFSVAIAEHLKINETNDLMIAGLFHDVGLMARAFCQKELMKKLIQKCKDEELDFYTLENQEIIHNHASIGGQVAKKWNLNERVRFLIENHHRDLELQSLASKDPQLNLELEILGFADVMAHRMHFGFQNYHRDTSVSKKFLDRLGLSIESVSKISKDVTKAVSSLSF